MQTGKKLGIIIKELEGHAPFTLFGAFTGIACMLLFKNLDHETSEKVFYVFHPAHVFLSAIVTASIFQFHTKRKTIIAVLLVGFFGSLGIGTLSDSLIPYVGEAALGMRIEGHSHGDEHDHENEGFAEEAHIGFIEGWYIVIPAAIAGVLIALFKPRTKIPHAGHVLLSTWASSFHMLMAMGDNISVFKMVGSFGFLFLAVLLPCCFSDIVFPLLFVKSSDDLSHFHHHH
ncbi:MAG: hypothetical protein FVQ84_16590 [Planctomycetes bacterium]|nr:hypothetical protein [Planctomycetota bacterium]